MVSVGVFVDLWWHPRAGGHVKCWERLAEAAPPLWGRLDLSVHFLGEEERVVPLAGNVRYVLHPPRLGTHRLPFLGPVPDHTDLAPWHSGLVPHLSRYEVLHATHPPFAFARTIRRYARRRGVPLTASVHTNTAGFSRLYTQQVVRHGLGGGRAARLALGRLRFEERVAAFFERRIARYWAGCAHALAAGPQDFERLGRILPPERIGFLRRGIDREAFHPRLRDRSALEREYGIPPEKFLLLFVGRLDPPKNVMTFARAARLLLERGRAVHAILAGEGNQGGDVREALGPAATLTGLLPQRDLARLYAGADLLLHPSEVEVTPPNVLLEAKASGLPALVAARGGAAALLREPGRDGVLVDDPRPAAWADAVASLMDAPERLAAMRAATRAHIEEAWPSWSEVLEEDLLPVWEAAAAGPGGRPPGCSTAPTARQRHSSSGDGRVREKMTGK